jgi:hypothetical protein
MGTRAHELVWAAVLLDGCPNVEVLTVRVESDSFWLGGDRVPVIALDVHAASQVDAATLAESLLLRENEGERRYTTSPDYGTSEWRTWEGWVPDGSREAAAWVAVTGADRVAGSAVA